MAAGFYSLPTVYYRLYTEDEILPESLLRTFLSADLQQITHRTSRAINHLPMNCLLINIHINNIVLYSISLQCCVHLNRNSLSCEARAALFSFRCSSELPHRLMGNRQHGGYISAASASDGPWRLLIHDLIPFTVNWHLLPLIQPNQFIYSLFSSAK